MQVTQRPLLVLHENRLFRDRLERVSQDLFELDFREDWESLREGVRRAPPAAVVVVDPYMERSNGSEPSAELRRLLETHPSATVVAALRTTPRAYRDIWTLGEWGVAEIIQLEEETDLRALRKRLRHARGEPLRSLVADRLPIPLTGRARSILELAVDTVMEGGHPRDLARTMSLSPSTLLRWCDRAQLPTPRRLLLWLRSVLAASLLDDPGHTVQSVGLACGYSGDQALRRALRSVIPHTPSQLREMGAFETVADAFIEELLELQSLDRAQR